MNNESILNFFNISIYQNFHYMHIFCDIPCQIGGKVYDVVHLLAPFNLINMF